MKVAVTLSIDSDVKKKAMILIQGKLKTSMSQYVEKKFRELIKSKSIKSNKEVKQIKCQTQKP